jgi:hypothetical protein
VELSLLYRVPINTQDIAYLDWKDPQDYSGIESYVAQKLADTDLLWIPFNKAIELADLNDDEAVVQRRQVTGISENVSRYIDRLGLEHG